MINLTNKPTPTVTVTKADIGLGNVPNVNTTTTANITDSLNKRFVSDADKAKLDDTIASVIARPSVSILASDWVGTTAPYSVDLTLNIPGETVTELSHDIQVIPVRSGTIDDKKAAVASYNYLTEGAITANNVLTLTCFDYKPEVTLSLVLEVTKLW